MKTTATTTLFLLLAILSFSQTRKVTIPSTIDSKGQSDVTVQLQQFINSVRDSTTILFPKGSTYLVEGTLCVVNRKSLTFKGDSSFVFAITDGRNAPISHIPKIAQGDLLDFWPRKRSQFYVRGGQNIHFENLYIRGSNPFNWQQEQSYNAALEAQHNIDAEGVDGLLVTRCTLASPWGDFIYLGKWNDYNAAATKNVVIIENEMHDNGRQGVSLVGTENVLITLNNIYNTRRATFDIEPDVDGSGSKWVYIKKNLVGQGRLMFVACGGLPTGEVAYITIDGNVIRNRAMSIACGGGKPGQRHHWTIQNNVGDSNYLYNSPRALIEMANVDYLTVRNNRHTFQWMQRDDLPGEGNDAVQVLGGKYFYQGGNAWTYAERACDTSGCTLALKPYVPKSELGIAGIKKLLPTVNIGPVVDGKFTVLAKYGYVYNLVGENGAVITSGSLKAGYTTIPLGTLKVGTKTFNP